MKPAVEILKNFYRDETAYIADKTNGKGDDPSKMLRWLSPNIKCIQSPDLAWGGIWNGREGLGEWAAQMGTKFSHLEVKSPVIYEPVDKVPSKGPVVELLMRCTFHLKVLGTGEDYIEPLVQILKVNEEEEVIEEIRPVYWNVQGLNNMLKRAGHI